LCPDAITSTSDNVMVLVVEDEADTRETVKEALELTGYQVRTAENGREALAVLAQVEPSNRVIMLLDLFMPVMDGWQVYSHLEQTGQLANIAVLIVTSAPHRAPTGAKVLAKPLRLERLLAAIASAA
jgi:two-component system, OmpR family, response regulator CpxR